MLLLTTLTATVRDVIKIIKRDFDSLIKNHKAEVNSPNTKAEVDANDDEDHCTSLFFAAEAGHEKVVNMLIKHKANVDATLRNAISHGRQEIVKILLKNSANTEVICIRTMLSLAAETGHVEMIKILLDYKQDTDVIKTTLDHAVDHRRMETVKYLLAEIAKTDNEQCFYHIYFAAKKKYENVVKLLLEEKTDIRLNYTAGKEDVEIINFLLKIGANRFNCYIDKHGRTPLHWAVCESDEKLVEDLTRKQTSLMYAKDENGETALHEAAWNGHTKIVKILLNQGANINCINKYDWKPLHIAVISFHIQVSKLLRNKDEDDFQLNKFLENFDYHK
ncbi:8995_t:CDS:2 [Gigaspora rosea]|nr:8995_t:CDS:2 [Gigaspora rosea]